MENKTVVAVVNDLFFSVKINEAAKRAGVGVQYAATEKDLLEKARAQPAMIIVDLNFDAAQPLKLVHALKSDPALAGIDVLGYLSHVQEDLRAKALEAGCDTVMPRSAFSANLGQIFAQRISNTPNATPS